MVDDPVTDDMRLAWLTQAENARAQLMMTGGLVEMTHNGKVMRWNRQNLPTLTAFIADLRGQLGLSGGRTRARRVEF